MTCEEVRVELVECWGSTEKLCAAAVAHLEVCAKCRYEALILRETHVMVRSLPVEQAPDGLTASVLDQIASEQAQPGWAARIAEMFAPARQPSWARAAAVGTAIALAVAGGTVWVNHSLEDGSPEQLASGQPGAIAVSSPARHAHRHRDQAGHAGGCQAEVAGQDSRHRQCVRR